MRASGLLTLAAPLAALALGSAAAGAQDAASPPARPALDGSRLRPERRVYRLTVLRNALPSGAGERVVTLRETSHGGVPAWAFTEVRTAPTATSTDSAVVSRGAFAPLHWEGTAAGARLVAGFGADTLYGVVAAPAGRRSVIVGGVGGALLNAATLEAALRVLPLTAGWIGTLPLLVVEPAGGRVLLARVTVDREEQVQVPAGRFDCWVVTVAAERPLKTFWISRDGRGVVRTEERLPDVDGALLEQALASMGAP